MRSFCNPPQEDRPASDHIGRQELLIGAAAAFLAAEATGANTADSHESTETEKANVKLLREFQDSFDQPTLDIDKVMARFLAAKASARWFDDEPRVEGQEAAANAAKNGAGNDLNSLRVKAHIIKLFARGPLVASSRVDTIKRPGKPDEILKIAGVCIIKDGKIQEYCDYIVT
jgi:limonene-1,2-epoxide hydrolase